MNTIHLTHDPIDACALLQRAPDPASGALVLFSGTVRDSNLGRAVLRLEYEAFTPVAETQMRAILDEARARWELRAADCIHRLGPVGIGESAVAVFTAAAHRGEAYAANRYIIDRIKHEVPIWKKEIFADGTSEWSQGCLHEPDHEHELEHEHERGANPAHDHAISHKDSAVSENAHH